MRSSMCVKVPQWLIILYTTTYFGGCLTHSDEKRKELDHFCINCEKPICCNCVSSHAPHDYVKIRRYMYCAVIKKQDLSKLFDCSSIQAYNTNKSKVLFLKQRSQQPQQQNSKDHSCIVCNRSLPDACFYCSIACKVSAISGVRETNETILDNKKTSIQEGEYLKNSETRDDDDQGLKIRRRKDKGLEIRWPKDRANLSKRRTPRKGIPRRAPFF